MLRAHSADLGGWRRRRPTEPLGGTVRFAGWFLVLAFLTGVVLWLTGHGSMSYGGFGHEPVCVSEPRLSMTSSDWSLHTDPAFAAKPGADVSVTGTVQACAQHPGLGQRTLDTLTSLPAGLVGLGVLVLLWRLVRTAERHGPFTLSTARLLRFTGWFIIVGSVLAVAAQGAATDALLNTMLKAGNDYGDVFPSPGALALPVLAGVVALTFARIVRVGVRMDEDLQGTV